MSCLGHYHITFQSRGNKCWSTCANSSICKLINVYERVPWKFMNLAYMAGYGPVVKCGKCSCTSSKLTNFRQFLKLMFCITEHQWLKCNGMQGNVVTPPPIYGSKLSPTSDCYNARERHTTIVRGPNVNVAFPPPLILHFYCWTLHVNLVYNSGE